MSMQTHLQPIEWSDEKLEKAINGAFDVYRWNQHIPYKLTVKERTIFLQAKQQGYVGLGAKESLMNVFHTWCEIHRQPLIYVDTQGRRVAVKMDLIYCEDILPHSGRGINEKDTEKLYRVYDVVAVKGTRALLGGTYNDIEGLDRALADLVAQSFVAIYRQSRGDTTVRVPSLPVPVPGSAGDVMCFTRAQRWAHTRSIRDFLHWRWEHACKAYEWPCIVVHELRKGYSNVEVNLPVQRVFTDEQIFSLRLIGKESGMQSSFDRPAIGAKNTKWFSLWKHGLKTNTSISTDAACYFADAIVNLLTGSGYFPPIDESWHL